MNTWACAKRLYHQKKDMNFSVTDLSLVWRFLEFFTDPFVQQFFKKERSEHENELILERVFPNLGQDRKELFCVFAKIFQPQERLDVLRAFLVRLEDDLGCGLILVSSENVLNVNTIEKIRNFFHKSHDARGWNFEVYHQFTPSMGAGFVAQWRDLYFDMRALSRLKQYLYILQKG